MMKGKPMNTDLDFSISQLTQAVRESNILLCELLDEIRIERPGSVAEVIGGDADPPAVVSEAYKAVYHAVDGKVVGGTANEDPERGKLTLQDFHGNTIAEGDEAAAMICGNGVGTVYTGNPDSAGSPIDIHPQTVDVTTMAKECEQLRKRLDVAERIAARLWGGYGLDRAAMPHWAEVVGELRDTVADYRKRHADVVKQDLFK